MPSLPPCLRLIGGLCVTAVACGKDDRPGAQPVYLYTAASAADALQDAAAECTPEGTPAPVVVAGSSATMARQIAHGAPADLFLSASSHWMDHLESTGHITADTRRPLLGNRLVLVAPKGSGLRVSLAPPSDLSRALKRGRLAMGDPDHVPAGMYGKHALTTLNLWSIAAPRLAHTADVRAALALVEHQEVPLGLVYATDADASDRVERAATIPAETHPPIAYPLAIVTGHETIPAVHDLWTCLQGPEAIPVFQQHGFLLP